MDGLMAERYGWTPEQIDTIDRARVQRWWAVRGVYDQAEQHLARFQQTQQQTFDTLEVMRQERQGADA